MHTVSPSTAFAAVFAFLAATALACTPAPQPAGTVSTPSAAPKPGGQLNIAVNADPRDWDVSYTGKSSPNDSGIAYAYDTLLSFKKGEGIGYADLVLQPELAERWESSPDAKTFTFQLRKGVRFAGVAPVNGRELTSADVKWSYEYQSRSGAFKDRKLPTGSYEFFFEGIESVETPDAYTAVVRLSRPFVPFLSYVGSDRNPIMAREIFDRDGHLKDRIAGSGAFQLDATASQKGTRWVWKKNNGFWQVGHPYLDEIRWLVLPEESTSYAAFQAKQLDVLSALAYRDFQEVSKANPQAASYKYLQPRGYHLWLTQARRGPLEDVRVRRAVALAVNRDEINKVAAGGEGVWAMPGVMPGLFTEAETKQLLKHDPNEAQRLLAEAGYPRDFTLEWPILDNEDRANLSWFELVQAQLKRIGMNVTLRPLEKTAQRNKMYTGDYELMAAVGTGILETDDDAILYGGHYSTSSANWAKINDPDLDRLLDAQRREVDVAKRRELQRAATKRIVDMVWAVDIIYPPKWEVWQPPVKNYAPHFGDRAAERVIWLDR